MGHEWRYTRGETAANLQLKCAICGLWIQQVHAQEVFHRIDSQPCKNFPNQGPQFWTALHPSHQWFSTGKSWECSGCGVSFGPAVAKEPNKASKTCSKAKVGVGKISFAKASPNRTEAQTGPRQTSPVGTEAPISQASPQAPPQGFGIQGPSVSKDSLGRAQDPQLSFPKASSSKTEVPKLSAEPSATGNEDQAQTRASSRSRPKPSPKAKQAKAKPKVHPSPHPLEDPHQRV